MPATTPFSVNTSDAVVHGKPHAHLYACTHVASSLSSSLSVHGTSGAEYLNAPTPMLVKSFMACSGVRGLGRSRSRASSVFRKILSFVSDISHVGVPHTPRYLHDIEGARKVTCCPMYTNVSRNCRWPAPSLSMTMAHVFFLLTLTRTRARTPESHLIALVLLPEIAQKATNRPQTRLG